MAAWKMEAKGETIGDGGNRLKVGKHTYEITGAELAPVKADQTGREFQVVLSLETDKGKYACKAYFAVMSENDQRRNIAEKELRAFVQACGIPSGVVNAKSLGKLIGNFVTVEAVENAGKGANEGKTDVNLRSVEPFDGDAPAAAADDDSEEESEEEEEEEEEEKDEEPAPKPSGKKRPW